MLKFMYDRKIQKTLVMRKTENYRTTKTGSKYPVFVTLGFIEKAVAVQPKISRVKQSRDDATSMEIGQKIEDALSSEFCFRLGNGQEVTDDERGEIDTQIKLEQQKYAEILRAYMQQYGKDLISKILMNL